VRALGDERDRVAAQVEEEAVALAFALAEKVVAGAIEASPEHVVDVVRGALRRLVERDHVHVLVHPDDLDHVRAATEELVRTLGGIAVLDVQAERRVGRGGALVRTGQGEIDARVETQLERAREVVAG
jgi:flagellar assembly protein FliH